MGLRGLLAYATTVLLSIVLRRCASSKPRQTLRGRRCSTERVKRFLQILPILQWNSRITDDNQSMEHCNALLQDLPRRQSLMKRWRLECSRPRSRFDATEQQISSRERYGLATVWHDELAQYLIKQCGKGCRAGGGDGGGSEGNDGLLEKKVNKSKSYHESTYAREGGPCGGETSPPSRLRHLIQQESRGSVSVSFGAVPWSKCSALRA